MDEFDPNYALRPTPTEAAKTKGDLFTSGKWMIEGGVGVDFLGQNYNSKLFPVGLGGYLAVGHTLDSHWSLWLSEDFYDYPPTQSSFIYTYPDYPQYSYSYPIYDAQFWGTVLSARYSFGGSWINPYLFAGPGLFGAGDNFYTSALIAQVGLGFQFPVGHDVSMFVESKVNFAFNVSYGSPDLFGDVSIDVPVNAGVVIDLPDSPPEAHPTPTPTATPSWFIKVGGGLGVQGDNYEYYGFNPSSFISSVAIGTEFKNHMSCFASVEQLPGAWALIGNFQYSVPLRTHFFSPYIMAGLGFSLLSQDVTGSTTNGCFLLGLGMEFRLIPEVTLFTETKLLDATLSSQSGVQDYGVFLSGLKFIMPFQPEVSNPSSSREAGKVFLEIAGGLDMPAQNWQTTYGTAPGEILSLGCEFKDGFAFQLDVENYSFAGNNTAGFITDNEIHLLPTVRYLFGKEGIGLIS